MLATKDLRYLNEIEMEIYRYTQNHMDLIPYMTIREFAALVHSSPPSILRFCRKLDYRGFTDFKAACKQELERAQTLDYSDDSTVLFRDFLAKVHTSGYQEKLKEAAGSLGAFDRIICVGDGISGSIAYYAAMYFTASGSNALYADSRYVQALRDFTKDAYVLISVSGESEPIVDLACKIRKSQGSCLTITPSAHSTLAKLSRWNLPYRSYYAHPVNNQHKAMKRTDESRGRAAVEEEAMSSQLPVVFLVETLASLMDAWRMNGKS